MSARRVMENNPLSCVKKTAHRVRTVRFPNDAQWNWASKIAAVEKKIYIKDKKKKRTLFFSLGSNGGVKLHTVLQVLKEMAPNCVK